MNAIAGMCYLHTLKLEGNPVCLLLQYPTEIFNIQNSLRRIDQWDRESISSFPNQVETPTNFPEVYSSEKLESLMVQVDALTESLEYQEQIIANNGMETFNMNDKFLLNFIVSSGKAFMGNHANQITDPSTGMDLLDVQSQISKDVAGQFPFYRLLSAWRKEFIRLKYYNLQLQKRCQECYAEKLLDRQLFNQKIEALELSDIQNEKKINFYHEKNSLLEKEFVTCQNLLQIEKQKSESISRELQSFKKEFLHLSSFISIFEGNLQSNEIYNNSEFIHCIDKLQNYESRILEMQNKLASIRNIMTFKEVQYRNSMAMVEVERSMLAFKAEQSKANLVISPTVDEVRPEHAFISELKIPTETESLLKTIFLSLDFHESGLVGVEVLLSSFLDECTEEDLASNAPSDFTFGGQNYNFTVVSKLLIKSMHDREVFEFFLRKLFSLSMDDDLSWGELLLFFVPFIGQRDSCEQFFSYRQEIRQLSLNNIVEGLSFSVFPFRISLEFLKKRTSLASEDLEMSKLIQEYSGHQCPSSLSNDAEYKNFLIEKKFLSHQCQFLTRQLSKTAELVRSFYEKEIFILRKQIHTIQSENESLQEELRLLRITHTESNLRFDETLQQYEKKMSSKTEELDSVRAELSSIQSKAIDSSNALISELRGRITKLENENSLLFKENSKKELKVKLLTKDMSHAQTLVNKLQHEKDELSLQFQKKFEAAAINFEEKVSQQNNRIQELERKLLESQKLVDSLAHSNTQALDQNTKENVELEHKSEKINNIPAVANDLRIPEGGNSLRMLNELKSSLVSFIEN